MTTLPCSSAGHRHVKLEADLAALVVRLLEQEAPVVQVWEEVAARLCWPRLPRHLAEPDQVAVVVHWIRTLRVETSSLFGLERDAGYRLAQLASSPSSWKEEVPRLRVDLLTAELVHGAVQAALLYAPVAPRVAGTLAQLAEELVQELERRGLAARSLRALRGEAWTARAVVAGLQGSFDRARTSLLRADRLLCTRRRLQDWMHEGRLVPPVSSHLALRSHALWLQGRALVEVAAGHLDFGARCLDQAFELYLADRAFFGAGLAAVLKASVCCWQQRPAAAVFPLETSLQLLDVRGLFRLGDSLQGELVVLYARLLRLEEARRELDRWYRPALADRTLFLRAEGWMCWAGGERERGLSLLLQARQEAPDAGTRRWLTVELASWEAQRGQLEASRTWLRAELARLVEVSPELQSSWRAVLADPVQLPALEAALQRAIALPQVPWRQARPGSLLGSVSSPPGGTRREAESAEA